MINFKSMLKKVWHDPVGSQLIVWMIIGILSISGVVYSFVTLEIKDFFLTSIPLWVVFILIAMTYTLSRIINYYSKKNRNKRNEIKLKEKDIEDKRLATIENQRNRQNNIWKIFNGLNYANRGVISKLIKTGKIDSENNCSYYVHQSKFYEYADSTKWLDTHIQMIPPCVKEEQIGENVYFIFDPYLLKLFHHYIETGKIEKL